MHQYKGRLIIHTGSMFSGKTSSLEKDLNRFNIAGYKTLAFKPSVDTRYPDADIITHDKISFKALLVKDILELEEYCIKEDPQVVGIDEFQFLGGTIPEINRVICWLLDNGITVVIAGLDMDFSGKPFETMKELMPLADYLNKHHAVCTKCGTDAWVSHRKVKSKERVVIGASDEYEPLCRACFVEAKKEEEAFVNKNQMKLEV